MRRNVSTAGLAITLIMATGSCSSSERSRAQLLTTVVEEQLIPAYQELAETANRLAVSLEGCPNGLDVARELWRATRVAWDKASIYRFGPQVEHRLVATVDYWPPSPYAIDFFADSSADEVLPEQVSGLSTGAKGLPAIEYLIFSDQPLTPRRCRYAQTLASNVSRAASVVATDWIKRNSTFAHSERGLSDLLSGLSDAVYSIADDELTMPAGTRTAATPDATLVRQGAAGMALTDIMTELGAIHAAYNQGVDPLVRARSAALAVDVEESFRLAELAVGAITVDLARAVTEQRDLMIAAADACRAVQRLIATQVASTLGLSLNIAAGDGD